MKPLADNPATHNAELDFKTIKQRFVKLNRIRLQRVKDDLRPSQQDFIELLPLLFHVNHPILPGYISKSTPVGVPEFLPGKDTLNAAKRLSKSFSWKKRAYRKFEIHALYLMGSTGTIAYSDKSDFDIWVCHDSSLSGKQIEELQAKAKAIENWAASMGVEANLFLVDAERFKRGEHGHLSSESSGSALHYLLLEEFYRTSVLLAGRYPIWWLVPPEQEHNYDAVVDDIKLKRYIHSREHIDFGGLAHINADEFYGATLWLLYKGINSPYKSILKILLMEAYASEYPHIDLLGVRFKKAIYEGEDNINSLDPYLMMMDKVEEYLVEYNQDNRLDLARRSFYFKIGEPLSHNNSSKKNGWRRELLSGLTRQWGWSSGQILKLDARDEWKINSVIDERQTLIREFTGSYRFLSLFARSHTESTNLISPSDLNVLGRKLYAAFERKAGKIDIIYKGITPNLFETHLSFHQQTNDENKEYWMVFSGIVNEEEFIHHQPLKRAYSLIEIMAWCYFNKIINKLTVLAIFSTHSDLTEKELHLLVEQMQRLFPDDIMENSSTFDMLKPAEIRSVATFVNAGIDPFSEQTRHGTHITSGRTDALKYGGKKENLTLSIDQVIITSWNEVLTFNFYGIEGLLECVQDYMKWSTPSSGRQPPPVNAFSFSSYRGTSIARRVELLFNEILNTFYSGTHPEGTRYILGVEWEYYILTSKKEGLIYEKAGDINELYKYLSTPLVNYQQTIFDSEILSDSILPQIYRYNKHGNVQFFFEKKEDMVDIYVLDERGSLFTRTQSFYNEAGLIKHYQEYFESIKERMAFYSQSEAGFNELLIYRIERASDGRREIIPQASHNYIRPLSFISLQVLVDRIENTLSFTLYCGDQEFTNLQYGDSLYKETAKYIISLRGSGERYPIYITDLDLSAVLIGGKNQTIQTTQYLYYKKVIEERLLNELKTLS